MYKIARNSSVRMILDTMAQWGSRVEYNEWDGHAEDFRLPETDLIGMLAFSCTENEGFHDVTFAVVIMTHNDPDLGRSTDYVDAFYRRLQHLARFPMFNDDGSITEFEAIVQDGTSVSPMGRVDFRPTVELQVSAHITKAGLHPQPS